MDDSAVISVHWWVTMTLLCVLALNSTEKVKKEKKKKKGEVFLQESQREENNEKSVSTFKILLLGQNQYHILLTLLY